MICLKARPTVNPTCSARQNGRTWLKDGTATDRFVQDLSIDRRPGSVYWLILDLRTSTLETYYLIFIAREFYAQTSQSPGRFSIGCLQVFKVFNYSCSY